MQLRTAEPVASQLATTIAGGLFAALLAAGLMALLAGVGAWYARSTPPTPLATRLPAWAVGVAVALAVAGLGGGLRACWRRATAPLWPALKLASLAWPLVGALVDPIELVGASGAALFVLYLLDRGTRGWSHRPWMAALLLVLISCAVALAGGGEPEARAAARRGQGTGELRAAVVGAALRPARRSCRSWRRAWCSKRRATRRWTATPAPGGCLPPGPRSRWRWRGR